MSSAQKQDIIKPDHKDLSIAKQCKVLKLNRSSYHYQGKPMDADTLSIMGEIDKIFTEYPFYGSRRITASLNRKGIKIGRHRVRRLMRIMSLAVIYKRPNTSKPHPDHKIFPYLLRDMTIDQLNQVWCSDITYLLSFVLIQKVVQIFLELAIIPIKKGFLYLVAIMDF